MQPTWGFFVLFYSSIIITSSGNVSSGCGRSIVNHLLTKLLARSDCTLVGINGDIVDLNTDVQLMAFNFSANYSLIQNYPKFGVHTSLVIHGGEGNYAKDLGSILPGGIHYSYHILEDGKQKNFETRKQPGRLRFPFRSLVNVILIENLETGGCRWNDIDVHGYRVWIPGGSKFKERWNFFGTNFVWAGTVGLKDMLSDEELAKFRYF